MITIRRFHTIYLAKRQHRQTNKIQGLSSVAERQLIHYKTFQPKLTQHSSNLVDLLGNDVQGFKSVFSCSGTITAQHLELFYKETSPSTKVHVQSFPCSSEALEPLLDLCEPATFGKGHKTVLDQTYRNALHLDPSKFGLNFMPSQYGILEQVRRYMMPNNVAIRDELYKLNIYGPGGHFKSHVDTPRNGGMFGSLVVCFPVEFKGGELVVQHKQTKNIFDFSSRGAPQDAKVQWAAFFADCEHKILPVTSGYRLTLTYNLYAIEDDHNVGDSISGFSSEPLAFHQTLASAIADPHFMESGGILGFGLQHAYPIKDEPDFSTKFDRMLKGTDAMIYVVAKKLGLTVSVVPLYPYKDDSKDEDNDINEDTKVKSNGDEDEDEDIYKYTEDIYEYTEVKSNGDEDEDKDINEDTEVEINRDEDEDEDRNEDTEVKINRDDDDDEDRNEVKSKNNQHSQKVFFTDSMYKSEDLCEDFACGCDLCEEYHYSCNPEVIKNDMMRRARTDITWCVFPKNLIKSTKYFPYGNDRLVDAFYVGAVMLVTIPRLGEGCRQ